MANHASVIQIAKMRSRGLIQLVSDAPVVPIIHPDKKKNDPLDFTTPRTFEEYVGQERGKEICKIIVDSAKIENRALPNMIIHGPFGVGKTTLAKLVMDRHGEQYRVMDASSFTRVEAMRGNILIEEIHNLGAETCDQLNIRMDQNQVHIVGTTTNPGELPAAFRSRLRSVALDDYTEEDIGVIIKNSLKRKGTKSSKTAIAALAARSRFNPRHALQILSFALELTTILKRDTLTIETVHDALSKLDIDERGLTALDRRYLSILDPMKPKGLSQICAVLGTNVETVENEIEPFLLKNGYIERTSRGRIIADDIADDVLEDLLAESLQMIQAEKKRRQRQETEL